MRVKYQEGFGKVGGGWLRHGVKTLESPSASVTETWRIGLTHTVVSSLWAINHADVRGPDLLMSAETPGSNKWAPRRNFHTTARSRDTPTLTLQQIPGGELWLHRKTERWRQAGGHKPRRPPAFGFNHLIWKSLSVLDPNVIYATSVFTGGCDFKPFFEIWGTFNWQILTVGPKTCGQWLLVTLVSMLWGHKRRANWLSVLLMLPSNRPLKNWEFIFFQVSRVNKRRL